ncbi:MAG: calcium/sodium antiporter [Lachnospiraceae bacterium]
MSLVYLVVGFVLLVVGADKFVVGASCCAKRLGVPALIIGLTIVAIGTSAPELAVSVTAGVKKSNEIALGNVVGSNIFNLLIVAGMSAMFAPLVLDREVLYRDFSGSIIATGTVFTLMVLDEKLSRVDAIILLIGFVIILALQIRFALNVKQIESEREEIKIAVWNISLHIVLGIAAIVIGGQLVVAGATDIAQVFGLSETIIGLTIVAVGTSLPELVTSIMATRRGELSIAIGNVLGSNIFNLLFILPVSVLCNPIEIQTTAIYDTIFLFLISLVIWIYARKHQLEKKIGMGMFLLYIIYLVWIILR